jgi:hypothetical protein
MPKKKGVRVIITGAQRRIIDVDAMVQIVIALGRELDGRDQDKHAPMAARIEAVSP